MDKWHAKWIWAAGQDRRPYNQSVTARKVFAIDALTTANLRITADSAYRLYINGTWVSDGPCRAWPEHYQYDEIDVTGCLCVGQNELRIVAKFWGTGTFHQVPQQAGLLAQLDLVSGDGTVESIATDGNWEVAVTPAWHANTPKVSIQMEPQELYDAQLADALDFSPATVLCDAEDGPWQDLHPRDVPLLTKEPVAFKTLLGANSVRRHDDIALCLASSRLAHPSLIEANRNVLQAGGIATLVALSEPSPLTVAGRGLDVFINGAAVDGATAELPAGNHLLVAFVSQPVGHEKEKTLRIIDPPKSLQLINPCEAASENPWCYLAFPEFDFASDDLRWPNHGPGPDLERQLDAYLALAADLGASATDMMAFASDLSERGRVLPFDEMFVTDTHWRFLNRAVLSDARQMVANPTGMLYDNAESTVVHPSEDGDVELVLDLGAQNIGYYTFTLTADAGVEIDLYSVEYIAPDGTVQHTWGNRNGMRYITRQGTQSFTSFKRRSGRYLFVTLRNQTTPVTIHDIRLIESTYPVNAIGTFRCSDAALTKIWEISARTLKLCMEDTFTDCPLYEQTLWVGDARNEALFAYPVFGAVDIGKRYAELAAQSLERYPIVGCQVPSGWEVLLPAWSFLWSISIWDAYAYTGDRGFVQRMWPAVMRNLRGAAELRDDAYGLFKGPFWNMFDWSGIDDDHEIVLHNSMLMVGAIDAAQKCAELLEDETSSVWLQELRRELTESLNALWNPDIGAYPDSIHEDGSLSPSTSQHTSFLALLYDIIPDDYRADALDNVLSPPANMVQVGSPFAMLTYYEALEKAGHATDIITSIIEAYTPMLEADATTVWEIFPTSGARPGGFPTRSHCHAWSSAPVYFLNRILLGVRSTEPGGGTVEVSPLLHGLSWAESTVATAKGPLRVAYRLSGDDLDIRVEPPHNVRVRYIANATHKGLHITFTVED